MVLVGDEQGEVTVYLLRNIPKPSDHQVMSDMWSYFDIAMYGSNNGNNIVYLHPKMCTLFLLRTYLIPAVSILHKFAYL